MEHAIHAAETALQPKLSRLRLAVSDLVDALGTSTGGLDGALMSYFERRLLGRQALPGSPGLSTGWLESLDAVTRLLYVRMAMLILAEPPDPRTSTPGPLGSDWLRHYYGHARPPGWEQTFKHAVLDPLFLVTTQLRREHVLLLGERSSRWPTDLRRRWTYAVALAAMAGYVF